MSEDGAGIGGFGLTPAGRRGDGRSNQGPFFLDVAGRPQRAAGERGGVGASGAGRTSARAAAQGGPRHGHSTGGRGGGSGERPGGTTHRRRRDPDRTTTIGWTVRATVWGRSYRTCGLANDESSARSTARAWRSGLDASIACRAARVVGPSGRIDRGEVYRVPEICSLGTTSLTARLAPSYRRLRYFRLTATIPQRGSMRHARLRKPTPASLRARITRGRSIRP
jgi:hypothetical protein